MTNHHVVSGAGIQVQLGARLRVVLHVVEEADDLSLGNGADRPAPDPMVGVVRAIRAAAQARPAISGAPLHGDVVSEDLRAARPAVGPVQGGGDDVLVAAQLVGGEGQQQRSAAGGVGERNEVERHRGRVREVLATD